MSRVGYVLLGEGILGKLGVRGLDIFVVVVVAVAVVVVAVVVVAVVVDVGVAVKDIHVGNPWDYIPVLAHMILLFVESVNNHPSRVVYGHTSETITRSVVDLVRSWYFAILNSWM